MTSEDVIKTIKLKGYWRISFEPLEYNEQAIPLSKYKELIEKNSLHLRGWDYPHMPHRQDDESRLEVGANYWQGWLDWQGEKHKEFWRMYQSTQFIHYLGLREDWIDGLKLKNIMSQDELEIGSGQGRIGFSMPRVTSAYFIPFEKIYTKQEIMENPNVNVDVIKSDQENLLTGRL